MDLLPEVIVLLALVNAFLDCFVDLLFHLGHFLFFFHVLQQHNQTIVDARRFQILLLAFGGQGESLHGFVRQDIRTHSPGEFHHEFLGHEFFTGMHLLEGLRDHPNERHFLGFILPLVGNQLDFPHIRGPVVHPFFQADTFQSAEFHADEFVKTADMPDFAQSSHLIEVVHTRIFQIHAFLGKQADEISMVVLCVFNRRQTGRPAHVYDDFLIRKYDHPAGADQGIGFQCH